MAYISDLFVAGGSKTPVPFLSKLRAANALYRQRKTLQRLTDHELADIGLTRDAVAHETAQPLWNSPTHWRK